MKHRLLTLPVALIATVASVALAEAPSSARPVASLAAVEMPDGMENPAPLAARIADAVSEQMRELGFDVVASDAFDAVWHRRVREAGGFYDIVTGRPDPIKRGVVRAGSLRELHEQTGAGFLLQPALVAVMVDFTSGKAEWDGAKETAAPTGSGEVPALSLDLRVEGLDGSEIASSRSGIQLLAKQSGFKTKIGPVPREKLLADEKDLTEAVRRGLRPLLDAMRSALEIAPLSEGVELKPPIGTSPPVEIQPPPEGARVAALRLVWPDRPGLAVPREVKTRCLDHLRSRLEEAGWWVLPPEAFDQTFRTAALESGGIYDPITGRGDPSKGMAAAGETRRRLADQYGARVFLTTGIVVRQAKFFNETATWDGMSEQVTDIAGWKKVLTYTHGVTKALSFFVRVDDVGGALLHDGIRGIQLIERVEGRRFVHVSDAELFRDPAREQQAIDAALRGWLQAPAGEEGGNR